MSLSKNEKLGLLILLIIISVIIYFYYNNKQENLDGTRPLEMSNYISEKTKVPYIYVDYNNNLNKMGDLKNINTYGTEYVSLIILKNNILYVLGKNIDHIKNTNNIVNGITMYDLDNNNGYQYITQNKMNFFYNNNPQIFSLKVSTPDEQIYEKYDLTNLYNLEKVDSDNFMGYLLSIKGRNNRTIKDSLTFGNNEVVHGNFTLSISQTATQQTTTSQTSMALQSHTVSDFINNLKKKAVPVISSGDEDLRKILTDSTNTYFCIFENGNITTIKYDNNNNKISIIYGTYYDITSSVKMSGNKLLLQNDGNLVLYYTDMSSKQIPFWSTGTQSFGPSSMFLDQSGNLIIKANNGSGVWNSSKYITNGVLKLVSNYTGGNQTQMKLLSSMIIEINNASQPTSIEQQPSTQSQNNWVCNGRDNVPLRVNNNGDVECMGSNGRDCDWKQNIDECNNLIRNHTYEVNPLSCGNMHKKYYGITGYEDPNHWCNSLTRSGASIPQPEPTIQTPQGSPTPSPIMSDKNQICAEFINDNKNKDIELNRCNDTSKKQNDIIQKLKQMSDINNIKSINSDNTYIYKIDSKDNIFYCKKPCDNNWKQIPGALRQITSDNKDLYGVNSNFGIYTCEAPCANGNWKQIPGGLVSIDATQPNILYGVNNNNNSYICNKPCLDGYWKQIV